MAINELEKAATTFAETMRGFNGYWAVAGGWAIDLFLGECTRGHEDLEIVVLREDHAELHRHFAPLGAQLIHSGDPPRFTALLPGPIDQGVIQLRLDPVAGRDFDLLLTPSEAGQWICRRDEHIRLPLERARGHAKHGVPYLAPEIVLLFKAKYVREKDEADFRNCLLRLSPPQKEWLREALGRVHPGHEWISRLG